jgi:hypothetical protein
MPAIMQGGRVEVGAPTGRWQLVVVYRGKHDPLCVTYLAALQVRLCGQGVGWQCRLGVDKRCRMSLAAHSCSLLCCTRTCVGQFFCRDTTAAFLPAAASTSLPLPLCCAPFPSKQLTHAPCPGST